MKIKRSLYSLGLVWVLLIGASFWWNHTSALKAHHETALLAARSFFDQIVITRQWNAAHGGIYAPVTVDNRPNPYLVAPFRDITVNDNLKLTMINPAFMTRQISEMAQKREGTRFHMTSLKPIRPQNKPTAQEESLLKEFENGKKEAGFFIQDEGKNFFFYMAPLRTEKSCLTCHAKQGYSEGDIRGGISVTMPFATYYHISPLVVAHVVIGLLGLTGIFFFGFKLNRAYDKIKNQAVFDALTDIPNRRNFSERILRECRINQRLKHPLSLIMCDIDNFKAYNDSYGHIEGDTCLRKVAKSIKNALDRPGDFCARYGGEEFVVILPDTPLKGARYTAEKIREAVEDLKIPHEKSTPLQTITLSLGIATSYETDTISADDLTKYADKALYRAKEKGKNRVESFSDVFNDSMDT